MILPVGPHTTKVRYVSLPLLVDYAMRVLLSIINRGELWGDAFLHKHVRGAFSLTGLIAPSVYSGLTVAVHVLNPRDGWVQYTLSDLALTHYGWIETLSMCVLAICVIAVGVGLYKTALQRRETRVALALFVVTSVALFAIAGFKSSDTAALTPFVFIHRASVVVLTVCFPVVCLMLVPALRSHPRWKSLALYSAIAGAIGLALLIFGAVLPRDFQHNVAGLWEKLFIADGVIWCQVFAVKLFIESRRRPVVVPGLAGARSVEQPIH